jgi:hypothetical protein
MIAMSVVKPRSVSPCLPQGDASGNISRAGEALFMGSRSFAKLAAKNGIREDQLLAQPYAA